MASDHWVDRRYAELLKGHDKSRLKLEAVAARAKHWREMGELFRESHPDITAWYVQFADELEELLRADDA